MTITKQPSAFNACNKSGNNCGSTTISLALANAPTGTAVTASGVPSFWKLSSSSVLSSIYTFTVTSKDTTRTTVSLTFSGCGTPLVVPFTSK